MTSSRDHILANVTTEELLTIAKISSNRNSFSIKRKNFTPEQIDFLHSIHGFDILEEDNEYPIDDKQELTFSNYVFCLDLASYFSVEEFYLDITKGTYVGVRPKTYQQFIKYITCLKSFRSKM